MIPHATCPEKLVLQSEERAELSCMFCDQTFTKDNLGPHVLTEHPAKFSAPMVLCVEGEFRIPGKQPPPEPSSHPSEQEEVHRCILCGQMSVDAGELEVHMRTHKNLFIYSCKVCGRRFKKQLFLKNHMKMHSKSAKSKAQQDPETVATINGVPIEPASEPAAYPSKMCQVCGFLFTDQDVLIEHSKMHNREVEPDKGKEKEDATNRQEAFLQGVNLQPKGSSLQPVKPPKSIPQLDPITTYQAWQLATKGKIAVSSTNNKEVSTDNDEENSDKERTNNSPEGKQNKTAKEDGGDGHAPQQAIPVPQRKALIQKNNGKEKPTTCDECQKSFRTYHQLVLHSRIHKRGKAGEESPKTSSPGHAEGDSEDGSLEGSGQDCHNQSKGRSDKCSHCGKSFKSSYYLKIHLRSHTAQKTSLKYHLQTRHKNKPNVEIPSGRVSSGPSPDDQKQGTDNENPPQSGSTPHTSGTPEGGSDDSNLVPPEIEDDDVPIPPLICVTVMRNQMPKEVPINLSRMAVSKAVNPKPKDDSISFSCSFCPLTTKYPEYLVAHNNMEHKDKLETTQKNGFKANMKRRRTGCPPFLGGNDVTQLLINGQHHRRTKSPPPQPEEKMPSEPPPLPSQLTVHPPQPDVRSSKGHYPSTDSNASQESAKYTEVMRKTTPSTRYPMDRMGIAPIWHPNAARLALSSPLGSLPQMDFGEPSNKRMKYSVHASMRAENGETSGRAGPSRDGSVALFINSSLKSRSQLLASTAASDALGAIKNISPCIGGGSDAEMNARNLLRSSAPNNLASLYHSAPANPSHRGLANPIIGGRAMLYPPLPGLPNLQRREASASTPKWHTGTPDKSAFS
ncbi:zinc finger protein 217 isoform 2-T2 [Pholidichthys leucotaenia]